MKNLLHAAFIGALTMSAPVPAPAPPRIQRNCAPAIKQLYGEWIVWHSNHPQFKGSNSNMLSIYPKKELAVRSFTYYGPLYCMIQTRGSFRVNTNECSLEDEDCHIQVSWYEQDIIVQSIFGIGVNEWRQAVYKKQLNTTMDMSLNVLDTNDIYITVNNYNIHLIRNAQLSEASANSNTLSSFVVSQILGNIIFLGLHTYFHGIF
jgi:hypothetical protein